MAVYEVVPARSVRCFLAQHLEGELAELTGQVRLVQIFERAGLMCLTSTPGVSSTTGG